MPQGREHWVRQEKGSGIFLESSQNLKVEWKMNLPRQLRRSSKKGSIRVLCFRSQERSMLWEGWHGFRYWILPRGPESWSLRNVHRWIIKCLKSALFLFLPSVALECELLLPLKVWEMGCHLLFTRCTYSRKKKDVGTIWSLFSKH